MIILLLINKKNHKFMEISKKKTFINLVILNIIIKYKKHNQLYLKKQKIMKKKSNSQE
jgi:hypothetical protein